LQIALSNPGRTKAGIQRLLAEFAELVQTRIARTSESDRYQGERPPQFAKVSPGCAAQESELFDQVQAMCILARFGVETPGWWNSMQQRFDRLAANYSSDVLPACCAKPQSGPDSFEPANTAG
jgi:hypothetical protein